MFSYSQGTARKDPNTRTWREKYSTKLF